MSPSFEHARNAASFVADAKRTQWHDESLWFVRSKRDKAAQTLPEWERLRGHAAEIRAHTLSRLAEYLEEFESNARRNGAHVHWAGTPEEHNEIVLEILRKHGASRIVKSKSMLTEECGLNPFLERHGLQVTDTDLGERIVQLREEPPSHIVLPAIHIKKEEVGELFHKHLGTDKGSADPKYLTEAARAHLRDRFLGADAGITGVNFAVASSGGIVVCTNEGNADLGASLPRLHIACMGLEKLVPNLEHLAVFLRLLARSATGQPITAYTSHFQGPRPDGELHIVMIDNRRSRLRGDPVFRSALQCIRCGACMNTCPVYRRSGGYSYQATVPGPIGSVLNSRQDAATYRSLPFACSLCGSCSDVCPVQIPLHSHLLSLRNEVTRQGYLPKTKRLAMWAARLVFARPWLYRWAGRLGRLMLRWLPRPMVYNRLNAWGRQRELPPVPERAFRDQYRNHVKQKEDSGRDT